MNRKRAIILGVLVATAALPPLSLGQSRHERSVRGALTVGWGPSKTNNYLLNRYYTGLNDLNIGYKPADGSGVLGSSIYRSQSMTIRPSGAAAPVQQTTPSPLAPRSVYQSPGYQIPTVTAPARPYVSATGAYLPVSTASTSAYRAAAIRAGAKRSPRKIPEEILTSLVPQKPAKHREQMIKGEEAFRNGLYAQALAHFETARQLSGDSPESLLSLGRTSFALAKGSYSEVARYLSKVLEILPELPLVKVFPRSFYGKQEDYLQHVKKLEDHIRTNPEDPEAQFVLGYLRWRQGKPDEARTALGISLASARTPWLTNGIKALLGGIAAAEQAGLDEPPEMDDPVEYPSAGIRLALPKGFEPRQLERMRQVVRAAKAGDGEPMIISLAAEPLGKDVTARGVWEHAMGFWETNPAISELRIVEERDVSIADLPAVGRLFTYTARGVEAAVLGLCFVREVDRPGAANESDPIRIGYAIVVATTRKQMGSMVGVINGVAQSAVLTKIRRPIEMPIELTDTAVRDLDGRYALRVPRGWVSGHDETGVVMGRMDYLLGGVECPSVRVVTLDVPESMSAKACGENAIEYAAKQQGFRVRILSQGPARLGDKDGCQFVLEKRVPLSSERNLKPSKTALTTTGEGEEPGFSQPFIEIGRMVSLPTEDGGQEFYVVIVTCYDCEGQQAVAVMEKLAPGFALLKHDRATESR